MSSPRDTETRHTLTLRQLRAFLLTAQNGSASAAARQLRVSQPAISQQLQELEKLLRVKLIERVGTRMLPTRAGSALIDPVRRALAAIEVFEPTIAPYRNAEACNVRIGTGATLCIHFLPGPIARAKEKSPGMQVLVVTGNVDELVKGIEDGALDVGILTTERFYPSAALCVEPFFSEDFVGILPASLAGELPETLRPEDLARHPLILFEPAGRTREIMDAWFVRHGIRAVPAMELGSVEAIKNMVGAGLGVSLIPQLAANTADTKVVYRPLSPPLQRHLCVAMRGDKVLDAGLRAFLAELRAAAPFSIPSPIRLSLPHS